MIGKYHYGRKDCIGIAREIKDWIAAVIVAIQSN